MEFASSTGVEVDMSQASTVISTVGTFSNISDQSMASVGGFEATSEEFNVFIGSMSGSKRLENQNGRIMNPCQLDVSSFTDVSIVQNDSNSVSLDTFSSANELCPDATTPSTSNI